MLLKSISLAVLCFLIGTIFNLHNVLAWDQPPHRQINFEAVKVFLRHFKEEEKFKLGPLTKEGLTKTYRGIGVKSSSLLNDTWRPAQWMGFDKYQIGEDSLSMTQWIAWGGDWADEPHLYASVRHFYDPLALWGHHYLTDQFEYHGWYDSPAIDAKTWALDHPENPFNYINALTYYRAALMFPETDTMPSGKLGGAHFKLNYELNPKDPDDQRNIFLAHAYRALGETMHLMADMTQPEHVRNDSHPIDSPIEKALNISYVRDAARYPTVDARVAQFLKSAGGALISPANLFHEVALFINQNFYSPDTIYDDQEFVIPQNIGLENFLMGKKKPYPSPLFKDLFVEEAYVKSFIRTRKVKMVCGPFINEKIPLAQERLSFHWFDPDMGALEKISRYHNLAPYHIPPSYAIDHARVQMPIAIYACSDLMYQFFPTLELETDFIDMGIQEDHVQDQKDYRRQIIDIQPLMKHHQEKDMAWKAYDLKIDYAGPAELVFEKDKKVLQSRKLHFLNGKLDKIEQWDGTMAKKPLQIYIPEAGVKLTKEEAFYQAEHGQTLYIEINAGSRNFKGPEYPIKSDIQVSIMPPRIVIYDIQEGVNEVIHNFEAVAKPDGLYRFEWDFGNKQTHSETKNPGEKSTVSHHYKNINTGDEFYPTVKIYDRNGDFLAEDTITIKVGEKIITMLPEQAYINFRAYGIFDENNSNKGLKEELYRIFIIEGPVKFTGNSFRGGESKKVMSGWSNAGEAAHHTWSIDGTLREGPPSEEPYHLISLTYISEGNDPHLWGKDCYGEHFRKIVITDMPIYFTKTTPDRADRITTYARFDPRRSHYEYEDAEILKKYVSFDHRTHRKGRYKPGSETYEPDWQETITRKLKQIVIGTAKGTAHESVHEPYNFWLELKKTP